jgi:hypothetical protein
MIDITVPEALAYLNKQGGLQQVEAALDELATQRSSIFSYEVLHEFAQELRTVELIDVAEVLEKRAERTPHVWDLPHRYHPDCTNLIEDWREEMKKRKEAWNSAGVARDSSGRVGQVD